MVIHEEERRDWDDDGDKQNIRVTCERNQFAKVETPVVGCNLSWGAKTNIYTWVDYTCLLNNSDTSIKNGFVIIPHNGHPTEIDQMSPDIVSNTLKTTYPSTRDHLFYTSRR